MYKNLNTAALGITGRQSELIELALTYGFAGLDLELAEIVKRARARGREAALRYLAGSGLHLGEFPLPVSCRAPELTYRTSLSELKETADIAAALGATTCTVTIEPYADDAPYHEHFELHRRRLGEIGEILAAYNIRLGVALSRLASELADDCTPFICEPETLLTLIRTVGSPQVGLTLDCWTWHAAGGTLSQLFEFPVPQICAVRLADCPPEVDAGPLTDEQRCLPGDGGAIDCAAVVRHLAEHGYTGPVTLHPHPSHFRGMTRDAVVRQAKATFDTLYQPADLRHSGQLEPLAAEPERA